MASEEPEFSNGISSSLDGFLRVSVVSVVLTRSPFNTMGSCCEEVLVKVISLSSFTRITGTEVAEDNFFLFPDFG